MRDRIGKILLVATWASMTWSCNDVVCTTEAQAGVPVHVVGGASSTSADACSARVTTDIHSSSEDFFCSVDHGDCYCDGAWERSGTYNVKTSVGDRIVDSRNVTVTAGTCHVRGVSYTVYLGADAG